MKNIALLNLAHDLIHPYAFWVNKIISFESFTFSGGEPHIKLDMSTMESLSFLDEVYLSQRVNCMSDLILILLAVDALRRLPTTRYAKIHLYIPYFPAARQDRIMVVGEPHSLKVMADIVNSMEVDSVTILDPHSDVTPALINNCKIVSNYTFIDKVAMHIGSKEFNLVSPDAGASKKIMPLAHHLTKLGYWVNVIKADKARDVSTGQITNFEVYAKDLNQLPTIVVDDICDGGGTFIGLAQKLKKRNVGDLYLAVTHGIFSNSKQLDILVEEYSKIYTTNSRKAEWLVDKIKVL